MNNRVISNEMSKRTLVDEYQRMSDNDLLKINRNIYSTHIEKGSLKPIYSNHSNEIISGMMSYMCPHCYAIYDCRVSMDYCVHVEFDDMIEADNVNLFHTPSFIGVCKNCGEENKFITLDYGIAYQISNLNKKGYKTKFCCEGHMYDDENVTYEKDKSTADGYIYFETKDILKYTHTLPLEWSLDLQWLKENKTMIRMNYENKIEGLRSIEEWIYTLPEINKPVTVIDESLPM